MAHAKRAKQQTHSRSTARSNVPIEKIVLSVIAAAGVIAVVSVTPGIGPAFRLFGVGKTAYPRRYVNDTIRRLHEKGQVTFEYHNGYRYVRLTKKGRSALDAALLHPERWQQRRWDGKWRIIMFDVPERRRTTRNKIRHMLTTFGCKRLQDSVWVFPYPCDEVIAALKAECRIGNNVLYITAERIENDGWLRRAFGLTKK